MIRATVLIVIVQRHLHSKEELSRLEINKVINMITCFLIFYTITQNRPIEVFKRKVQNNLIYLVLTLTQILTL